MLQALLAVSAIVPSLLLVWYFHARDAYPEPAKMIWTTFGLGIATVFPVLMIGLPIHWIVSTIEVPVVASGFEALFVAAIPEEFFKLLVLVFFSMRAREFDEPMDGIVYGVVASLGFATFENILYVLDGGTTVAISRAFSAVPLHAFLGAIMGYYVGQAWKCAERRKELILRGYIIAVILHAVYDFPLMTMNALDNKGPNMLLAVCTLSVLIVAWRWALRLTRGLRKEQLEQRPAIMQPSPAFEPAGVVTHPVAVRPGWSAGRAWSITQIALGVVSASLGGMVTFGLMLAFLLGVVAAEDTTDVLLGGMMIGALPLVVGGSFFRQGVKGLNRGNSTPLPAGGSPLDRQGAASQ